MSTLLLSVNDYDIQEKTALRHLVRVRVNLQILAGESEALKALQAACDRGMDLSAPKITQRGDRDGIQG